MSYSVHLHQHFFNEQIVCKAERALRGEQRSWTETDALLCKLCHRGYVAEKPLSHTYTLFWIWFKWQQEYSFDFSLSGCFHLFEHNCAQRHTQAKCPVKKKIASQNIWQLHHLPHWSQTSAINTPIPERLSLSKSPQTDTHTHTHTSTHWSEVIKSVLVVWPIVWEEKRCWAEPDIFTELICRPVTSHRAQR